MKEHIEHRAFTAYLLPSDILQIDFKKTNEFTLKDLEDLYETRIILGEGKKIPTLLSFQGFIPRQNREVMQISKSNKYLKYTLATAYVIHSFAIRLGVKFYMNFYSPAVPIKIFNTKKEAITWLMLMREKERKENPQLLPNHTD